MLDASEPKSPDKKISLLPCISSLRMYAELNIHLCRGFLKMKNRKRIRRDAWADAAFEQQPQIAEKD